MADATPDQLTSRPGCFWANCRRGLDIVTAVSHTVYVTGAAITGEAMKGVAR
jgi:hypothetical protein